jgi:hypothetical protein
MLDYIASNERVTEERWIGKDLEGRGHGLIEVLSEHLPRGTEENHWEPQSGSSMSLTKFEPSTFWIWAKSVTDPPDNKTKHDKHKKAKVMRGERCESVEEAGETIRARVGVCTATASFCACVWPNFPHLALDCNPSLHLRLRKQIRVGQDFTVFR